MPDNETSALEPIITSQRHAPTSPSVSDESVTGDSIDSSDTEESLVSTKPNSDALEKAKISIPSIFIKNSSDWRRAALIVFNNSDLSPETVCAQATSDGSIIVKTREPTHYRQLQKILLQMKIPFQTSKLPKERTLKVVLRGIPIDITPDDLRSDLELLNFDVKLVKRFGPPKKPMPICLVVLGSGTTSKEIFELNDLFFIKISVETYKQSGPSQCFACQRIGHGSSNCTHPPRCVKCSGEHQASKCPKTMDQDPTCCNCGGSHTANYRGCPYLTKATIAKSAQISTKRPMPTLPAPSKSINTDLTKMDYTTATKSKEIISNDQIIALLTDFLKVISSTNNLKEMLSSTIKSFLTLFGKQT